MSSVPTAVSITDHAFLRIRQRVPFFAGMSDPEISRLVGAGISSAVSLAPALAGRRLVAVKVADTEPLYLIIKIHDTFTQVITCFSEEMAEDRVRQFTASMQRSVQKYAKGYTGKKPPRKPRPHRRRDVYPDDDDE